MTAKRKALRKSATVRPSLCSNPLWMKPRNRSSSETAAPTPIPRILTAHSVKFSARRSRTIPSWNSSLNGMIRFVRFVSWSFSTASEKASGIERSRSVPEGSLRRRLARMSRPRKRTRTRVGSKIASGSPRSTPRSSDMRNRVPLMTRLRNKVTTKSMSAVPGLGSFLLTVFSGSIIFSM